MLTELSFNPQPSIKERLSRLAKGVLPIDVLNYLHLLKYRSLYLPNSSSVEKDIAGFKAIFSIRNHNDAYRLQNELFEKFFSLELITTVANTPMATVVDIGCAQGIYSIFAAKAGAAKVIAIDPDPISAISFKENLKLNPDTNNVIHFIQVAISNQSGQIPLKMNASGDCSSSLMPVNRRFDKEIMVTTTTLDELMASKAIATPDIIKIDVEGAEALVLQGMSQLFLQKEKPSSIFIEIHTKDLPLFHSNANTVNGMITQNGYKLTNRWPRGYEWLCHYQLSDAKPL